MVALDRHLYANCKLVLEALFKVVLLASHNCHIAGSLNANNRARAVGVRR